MLQYPLARLEAQVEPRELRVAVLELVHDAQGLEVVLEAAVVRHALVQGVLPGVAELGVGNWTDPAFYDFGATPPQAPARLVDALLLRITGTAHVEIAQTAPVMLNFSSAEIAGGVLKTAQTETLAASLVGTLLGDLDLTVNVLGIGLNSPAVIAQALRDLLAPLTPTLDLAIAGTLGALGLGVGEGDVRVYGVRCDHAVLVG